MATFSRVLVGYDGGEHAKDALALGRLIADRSDAELVLASIVPIPIGGSFVPALPADAYTELTEKARASLEEMAGTVERVPKWSSHPPPRMACSPWPSESAPT